MAITIQQNDWTVGDTRVAIGAALKKADKSAMDLSGLTVAFRMVNKSDNSVKVNNAAATVVDAATGLVSYTFGSSDVNTAGTYYCFFIVTGSGKPEHFPKGNDRWELVLVASL